MSIQTKIEIVMNTPLVGTRDGSFQVKGSLNEAVEYVAEMLQKESEFKNWWNRVSKRANEMRSQKHS